MSGSIEGILQRVKTIAEETLHIAKTAESLASGRRSKARKYLEDTRAGKAPTH